MSMTHSDFELSNSSSERQILATFVSFALVTKCKEPSVKENNEKIRATILGFLRDEIAEFEKDKQFVARWYKMMTSISADQDKLKVVTALFDTGIGFNLI